MRELPTPKSTQDVRANFYTSVVISSLEFGAVCGKQRALFQPFIPFSWNCLPLTAPISTPRPPSEPGKYKLSNGVLRSGNGAVDVKYSLRGLFGHVCLRKG